MANANLPQINIQAQIMGRAIPQGMAQGIQQNSAAVTQAVGGMAQSAVNQARSTLGISSPSRVFQEMGWESARGYRDGLLAGGATLSEASRTLAADTAAQFQEGLHTGYVYMGGLQSTKEDSSGDRWGPTRFRPEFLSFDQWLAAEEMIGGFGSGVQAASDGTMPIAQSSGLKVGDVWARSVVTGADSVIQSADFASLVVPQIGSALAKTALGAAGLLPAAGSGAASYNTTQGGSGVVTMSSAVTVQNKIYLDGQIIDSKIDTKIDQNNEQLIDKIGAQRG